MPSAFKVVRADDRRSAFSTPGLEYQPGAVITHRGGRGRGVWAYETRQLAEQAHPTNRTPLRIIELEYEQADLIAHGRGVVRLMRCRVLPEPGEKVPRRAPVIDVPTPRELKQEHVATLRAAAVIGGRRSLSPVKTADETERLVRRKVAAAKRKARRAAA